MAQKWPMPRVMSLLLVLSLVLLSRCAPVTPVDAAIEVVGAVTIGSVATIGRTPLDAAYSMITGKDCSLVRMDQGKTYCRPTELLPATLPYCTRSLGVVDCWQDPAAVPNLGPDMASGPRSLTPAQEKDRTRTWPNW
jgi:hypothetical protein